MKKVSMNELLKDNQELSGVLDYWNGEYLFQIYQDENNGLYREDLQEPKGSEDRMSKYSVEKMIQFYIEEIEGKTPISFKETKNVNGKIISDCFAEDYKVLLKNKSRYIANDGVSI